MLNFAPEKVQLQFLFENPLMVSTGSKPDQMKMKIVNPTLFISKVSGKTLEPGSEYLVDIPEQFASQLQYDIMRYVGWIISMTFQTVGIYLFFMAILFVFSMKGFWMLMNILQIIAYLRHLKQLPANLDRAIQYIHEAVSF